MDINRVDLTDIRAPRRLGRTLHELLGRCEGAVPIFDIARALDIAEIHLDAFDGFEGMLLTDPRRSTGVILANTRHGQPRTRFTVAHELGHFLLEHHVLSDVAGFRCMPADLKETREGKRHFRQETEANLFAIETLAPAALVKPYLNGQPDLRKAQQMRDHLDISLEAAIRRFVNLHSEPLAAIWSHNGQVRYFIRNKAFPFLTCARRQPLPRASFAFRAVQNSRKGFTEMKEVHGITWTSNPELGLREQTKVGQKGYAVTLLWADIPDDEDGDEGGLPELGTPGFR